MLGLQNKVAVVLGGGQGMGERSALRLAEAGCDVAVVDVELARAEQVALAVRKTGRRALALRADALDDAAIRAALAHVEKDLGGIDVLVCIIGMAAFVPLLDMDDDVWDLEQRRNLRYVFVAARAAARAMIRQGRGGSIVCIASVSGIFAAPHHGAYGAAKAGLIGLVKTMAAEWGEHGIRVNAVAPGVIETPRLARLADPAAEAAAMSPLSLKRRGTTDDIGKAVTFLASDMASYVTGHTLPVDGGWTSTFLLDPRRPMALTEGIEKQKVGPAKA
jgi:NAD(P)-dependent dehydrogenase (short-subunit alcohol dehydrogenase family)